MTSYVIGFDLGGTTIAACLATKTGEVLATTTRPTNPRRGPAPILFEMVNMADELLGGQHLGRDVVAATGMGVPCLLEKSSAVCRFSPNLFWHDVDIGGYWQKHFNSPLTVDNDVRLGALAEYVWGATQNARDFLYVAVGTGIGSGLFLNGSIYRGSRGLAGEIGHMVLRPDGPPCNCGHRGCLEAYAAGPAIARRAQEAMDHNKASLLWELCQGDKDQITAEHVSVATDSGDQLAGQIMEETAYYLGTALASVATLLNPERIIVGGGVAEAGEKLFNPLRHFFNERVVRVPGIDYPLLPASLGTRAGVIGAATAAIRLLDDNKPPANPAD